METPRIRSYLQAVCAGLGFEIGEVWWHHGKRKSVSTTFDVGPSFVQLYTSKSFEDRRSMLVNPPPEDEVTHVPPPCTKSDLQKHVLSPRLVEAIAENAQVVWANTRKTEGLTGRSDIPLHTAVGMPVASDSQGNMCVVVMFSPSNIQSTDEALEYLNLISKSATSSTIPCLMPAFENPEAREIRHLPAGSQSPNPFALVKGNGLGEGVVAKFVTIDERSITTQAEPEVHLERNLAQAPKDCFGIPMLPSSSELSSSSAMIASETPISDAFDEAAFGIWATIMGNRDTLSPSPVYDSIQSEDDFDILNDDNKLVDDPASVLQNSWMDNSNGSTLAVRKRATISIERKDRLEEFCEAFLGMSVFDIADVWVEAGPKYPYCLNHVLSISSSNTSEAVKKFNFASETSLIKFWNGAVGRAFSSGNPVWSTKPDVFVDDGRAPYFLEAKILAVLAIPIFYGKNVAPAGVVCYYSLVRANSVPFVLRFVQQALRMLWAGLDKVEPHQSVGKEIWQDVGPADLGEMAADVEMQHHFMSKKRPRTSTNAELDSSRESTTLSKKFDSSLDLEQTFQTSNVFLGNGGVPPGQDRASVSFIESLTGNPSSVNQTYGSSPQDHDPAAFEHISTNVQGTKRAHIVRQPEQQQQQQPQQPQQILFLTGNMTALRMPNTLPSRIVQPHIPATSMPTPILPSNSQQQTQEFSDRVVPNVVISSQQQQQPPSVDFMVPGQPPPMLQFVQAPIGTTTAGTAQFVLSSNSPETTQQICLPTSVSAVTYSVTPQTKPCRIQGCDEPSVARRPYCVHHSGNRLCERAGCNKCAQGSTRFCIAHGGGRRCTHPGCDKGARDKFFCAAHGGGKRCSEEGCKKSAVGGSSRCTFHGGGRRCAIDGCDKSAQSSTKYCVKHGGGKKCAHETCDKVARGRTLYCAAHGGGVRCKLEGCNRVAIGKLQLCRAHGGGSRRQKASAEPEPQEPSTCILVNSVLPSFSL